MEALLITKNGNRRSSIAFLKKGTVCTIHVGGESWNDGGNGTSDYEKDTGILWTSGTGGKGGGSSYITVNTVKIISAQGGAGGGGSHNGDRTSVTVTGGAGGGTTALNNIENVVTWNTSQLNITTSEAKTGNGQIIINYTI